MIYNSISSVGVPLAATCLRKNNAADFDIIAYHDGKKKHLNVFFNKQLGQMVLIVRDGRKHVATLSLFYPSDYPEMIPAYAISTMGVIPEYQGLGIGKALYSGLMNFHHISLLSSNVSLGARKMWFNLCKEKNISTYIYDQVAERYYKILPDEELNFSFIDYENKKNSAYTHNERYAILATKKKGQHDRIIQRKMKVDQEQKKMFTNIMNAFRLEKAHV